MGKIFYSILLVFNLIKKEIIIEKYNNDFRLSEKKTAVLTAVYFIT
ncbi:MAG: hypothetical protein IKG79_06855 [Neisseriaceae bacterium]|nr:hypothetical protein [Neisseriaceae bacterium]